MKLAEVFATYLGHLFSGRRYEARDLLLTAQERGAGAEKLLLGIIWPAMEQIQRLYRANEIPTIVEHMATRLNRLCADQLQGLVPHQMKSGQRMIVLCGEGENEELGAQIMADMFEAQGWTVWFLGAGVPNDEILEFLSQVTPDLLCVYGTCPPAVPNVRRLIDLIREVGICPHMQILTSGGVFNRAEGLSEEIGADLFAENVPDALELVSNNPVRTDEQAEAHDGRRKAKRSQSAKGKLRSNSKSGAKVNKRTRGTNKGGQAA
ncbi:MAG: cobalamin B12-binding domain-containing protein [Planctomycetota bacterium]|jgi:methanogenic corrinoid protein MtbC1